MVARRYARNHLEAPSARGLRDDDLGVVEHFEPLVRYGRMESPTSRVERVRPPWRVDPEWSPRSTSGSVCPSQLCETASQTWSPTTVHALRRWNGACTPWPVPAPRRPDHNDVW